MPFQNVVILGSRIDLVQPYEVIGFIEQRIENRRKTLLTYINIHAINLAYTDFAFRKIINNSDLIFCDGFGVKLAAEILFKKKLHRMTPPDWFDDLFSCSEKKNHSIFLLGSHQQVIENASKEIKKRFPAINITGIHNGYFDKNKKAEGNIEIIDLINLSQPDILIVGFGMPIQEKWIFENKDQLNVRVIIPVGAYFDYLTGEVHRVPNWMTDHGLEWLGRLIIEPGRLWKRYIIGNPLFFWRVLYHHILGKPLPGGT
jgi:N-acetylglucosaminyldiphosphoundecaprenol N-acetyl-beta-D-mannosaminyltransferase